MGETERDLLERCRVLESRLGTLGAYAHIVKTLGPFVYLNDQHQFVVIEDAAKSDARVVAAAELTRLRKIEAAARAVTVDFNPMFNSGEEFNIRLRKLYASIIQNKFLETETDD